MEATRAAGGDIPDRGGAVGAGRQPQTTITLHDGDGQAIRFDDRGETHRSGPRRRVGRSGATASRMTSAIPGTPVQRSNAIAAWAMSISDPLAARRSRARAAASNGVSAGT